ncbi:MAG: TIGR01212 family radical SAM protein, partial [Syntrophomonadaceae bacterium]|nr:TIGR01212 family radical SAM protein [Syntrophomonadaceae bacterium]
MNTKTKEYFTWNDKRYHTLNYHLRKKFGQKVFKISLDAGFTCP